MRRRKFQTSIVLVLFLFFLLTLLPNVVCNPIPLDEKYESSPISSSNEGSISFTKELINVTFDLSKAYFNAIYTFKNTRENAIEITIQLPLMDYDGPDNLILKKDQTNLDFNWVTTKIQLDDHYSEEFRALEFLLSFRANEEIEIFVKYSRPYMIYDFSGNKEVHYSYKYLVGTTRGWNQPIESAYFEFWIPEAICDSVSLHPDSPTISSIEIDPFRVLSVSYSNWIPEDDYIGLYWRKEKPFGGSFLTFSVIEPLSLVVVLFISIFFIKLRNNHL